MPSAKLTKRAVDAAEPRERLYILYDQELRRFRPSGHAHRVQVMGCRVSASQERGEAAKKRLAIGSASALTAYEARTIAKDMLAGMREREDPLASRSAERRPIALGDLAKQFLVDHIEQKRKPKTVRALSTRDQPPHHPSAWLQRRPPDHARGRPAASQLSPFYAGVGQPRPGRLRQPVHLGGKGRPRSSGV